MAVRERGRRKLLKPPKVRETTAPPRSHEPQGPNVRTLSSKPGVSVCSPGQSESLEARACAHRAALLAARHGREVWRAARWMTLVGLHRPRDAGESGTHGPREASLPAFLEVFPPDYGTTRAESRRSSNPVAGATKAALSAPWVLASEDMRRVVLRQVRGARLIAGALTTFEDPALGSLPRRLKPGPLVPHRGRTETTTRGGGSSGCG